MHQLRGMLAPVRVGYRSEIKPLLAVEALDRTALAADRSELQLCFNYIFDSFGPVFSLSSPASTAPILPLSLVPRFLYTEPVRMAGGMTSQGLSAKRAELGKVGWLAWLAQQQEDLWYCLVRIFGWLSLWMYEASSLLLSIGMRQADDIQTTKECSRKF